MIAWAISSGSASGTRFTRHELWQRSRLGLGSKIIARTSERQDLVPKPERRYTANSVNSLPSRPRNSYGAEAPKRQRGFRCAAFSGSATPSPPVISDPPFSPRLSGPSEAASGQASSQGCEASQRRSRRASDRVQPENAATAEARRADRKAPARDWRCGRAAAWRTDRTPARREDFAGRIGCSLRAGGHWNKVQEQREPGSGRIGPLRVQPQKPGFKPPQLVGLHLAAGGNHHPRGGDAQRFGIGQQILALDSPAHRAAYIGLECQRQRILAAVGGRNQLSSRPAAP